MIEGDQRDFTPFRIRAGELIDELQRWSVTECRVRHVAIDSREFGQSRSHSSAHGNNAETDGHRLGGEQHPLHRRERFRQTNDRLQEVLLREKPANRARLYDELPIHGRPASRDPLHGKLVPCTFIVQLTSKRSPIWYRCSLRSINLISVHLCAVPS